MKHFWKKHEYKTLEIFLVECVNDNIDFCLSFRKIPNHDFVPRFKSRFEAEFMKLQAMAEATEDA